MMEMQVDFFDFSLMCVPVDQMVHCQISYNSKSSIRQTDLLCG